jgi:hypothetical protein
MRKTIALCAALMALPWAAGACPTDTQPRATTTLLSVEGAGPAAIALHAAGLAALPQVSLVQRQTVSSSASGASDRSVTYAGVLLRDVLAHAGFGAPTNRGARVGVIEAVATDGYRAVFSWGEVFNSGLGEQVLVISTQDSRALDAAAGPLALRSLGDLRPGPRHVRNLCALVIRR